MDALFTASIDDAVIRAQIIDVIHMLKPPAALFGPVLIARSRITPHCKTAPTVRRICKFYRWILFASGKRQAKSMQIKKRALK